MKKKFSIIDGGSENNKEKFRTVVANNSDDTTVVSSTTATKFTRVRNLFIFIWVFFLAVWSAPILNETIRSLEAKDTRESLLLVLIFVSKVQQTSYCIAGATQMCYVLQLVDLQSKRLQILVLKDAGNVCLLNAHMVEELVVSATNFLQDTKEVCKSLQGITIFYLVYVFIAIVQVGAGIASAWVADETAGGEKLLVPFFLVQVVFGTGAIFASLMMSLGKINLSMRDVGNAIVHLCLVLELRWERTDGEDRGSQKRKRALKALNIFGSLNKDMALFFGLPITPKVMGAFASNIGVAIFFFTQFLFFNFKQFFTFRFACSYA